MSGIAFRASEPLTFGIELELQLLDRHECDLARDASELIALVNAAPHPGEVKPEITDSMVEISTGVHRCHADALAELRAIRDCVVRAADQLNVLVSGGGAHPFQRWTDRRIFDQPRFRELSRLYGYLARQFTVFGQHVHLGVPDGDSALRLLHALSRYVPHFIALASSSPFQQGSDTSFDSSRLNTVAAFPLSGRAPAVDRWTAFESYFESMRATGIVASMKDFYWDIRPKPEYGTVEIRVFDTPLGVDKAVALAAYAQAIAARLLEDPPVPVGDALYLPYSYNRFQACRFGLAGDLVDPLTLEHRPIHADILATLDRIDGHAGRLGSRDAMHRIRSWAQARRNDAAWARETYQATRSLTELAWRQAALWRADEVMP
jgi:carboxylate-amine ligase